jgi:hypothetical protein
MRRFLRWLLQWPYGEELSRLEGEISELKGRLEVTHYRMREMYWEEKAKEAAYGLIALLIDEIKNADPENEKIQMIESATGMVKS